MATTYPPQETTTHVYRITDTKPTNLTPKFTATLLPVRHLTPTPYSTLTAEYYHTWTRFRSELLGIEIDYPAYFSLPPYSESFCAPIEDTDPFNGNNVLDFGAGFRMWASPVTNTLTEELQATQTEMKALGEPIHSIEQKSVDGVSATVISYSDFLGRPSILIKLIQQESLLTISVSTGRECTMLAAEQGYSDALNELDMLTRMFKTLTFIR